ncbi:Transcriptional regulator GlxA family, contains an amidase domain and an AraC-type DNA-binding HTH domain [Polaromonas sp. YR568]|uniref:GlxA family transcriptional regulator n=1 Tax=Polaromonas sp. YR568 TaxID=1855301 RepID=UPI0008E4687A|nr:helix-turn-helix domain-containing protein [Polaromonas sp. YR568]SFU34128.1 Transcriptional regulator GlxA family, contains an amidase domain and an AraC-type DNA-binding HTH domain [Polaromonas sp. YR568]
MTDFTILVLPGAFAASVASTLDVLQTASSLAPRMKLARPAWRVVSPRGGSVPLSSGMSIETVALPKRYRADAATWIIPGLGLDNAEAVSTGLAGADAQRAIQAVAAHAAGGGRVAASCSAVFLLQAAGLLAGRRVTTSWWMAAELRRLEPDCTVDADRMVCADGPVSTAGAAFAQTDLMLHLLRAQFGVGLADAVGRILLIDGRQAQSPFVLPAMLSNGNELVARLMARIESALPHPPSVEALAGEFAMSQRTLSRHVREATGQSTMALVQSVRLHRARMLIESSRMSIERVAEQVGYGDATALRRLMRKSAGANPSRYRPASPRS